MPTYAPELNPAEGISRLPQFVVTRDGELGRELGEQRAGRVGRVPTFPAGL
jgi:hypothetical protein